MLQAIDPEGRQLAAEFTLAPTLDGFDLFIESRSGASDDEAPRNRDYERLMALVFQRAAALDAELVGSWVASTRTRDLPADERLLRSDDFPYPIRLRTVPDLERLRTRLSAAQGGIGRRPGARGPGNRNKRVQLSFRMPEPPDARTLEDSIVLGAMPWPDLPVPDGPRARASDLARVQAILDRYEHAAPRVRRAVQSRVERGPVGELVKALTGRRCQICAPLGLPGTPFADSSGQTFLEAHHVEGVAAGGAGVLRAANVIALCPNHHRELHHGRAARVIDLGQAFEITVEAGTVTVQKLLAKTGHETLA